MTDSQNDHKENDLVPQEAKPVVVPAEPAEHMELTPEIAKMVDAYVAGIAATKINSTPMHMDEIASRVAKFYEMIRKVIDWKEDNVLRRAAIERILERLLFPKLSGVSTKQTTDSYRLAYTVTADLIRGGHLPNDEIPQESILVVETALKKYLHILSNVKFATADPLFIKRKINFTSFIIELAACEIEELLTHPVKEEVVLQVMTELLSERIKVIPADALSENDKKTHIFIAACRTLYDLDDAFILYQFLKFSFPWWHAPTEQEITQLTNDIPDIWEKSAGILNHPLSRQFYAICERVDTIFMLLGDVMDQVAANPKKLRGVLENKTELTRMAEEAYDKRFTTLKKRLIRLAIFSSLSVFLSNWFTYFIIEVPMANVFFEGFNPITTLVDFVVPSVVMFLLVSIIRPPAADNKPRVLTSMYRFFYTDEKKILYEVRAHHRRNPLFAFVVGVLYFTMMIAVLGSIGFVFWFARLPITSVVFDTFTIALTIFAAVLIRNKAKELVVDERTTVWEFFLDMLSVPTAKVGGFLANKWKEYNVIAILFTFLIETPFVVVVDFIENWSQYLKERRSELH